MLDVWRKDANRNVCDAQDCETSELSIRARMSETILTRVSDIHGKRREDDQPRSATLETDSETRQTRNTTSAPKR